MIKCINIQKALRPVPGTLSALKKCKLLSLVIAFLMEKEKC